MSKTGMFCGMSYIKLSFVSQKLEPALAEIPSLETRHCKYQK